MPQQLPQIYIDSVIFSILPTLALAALFLAKYLKDRQPASFWWAIGMFFYIAVLAVEIPLSLSDAHPEFLCFIRNTLLGFAGTSIFYASFSLLRGEISARLTLLLAGLNVFNTSYAYLICRFSESYLLRNLFSFTMMGTAVLMFATIVKIHFKNTKEDPKINLGITLLYLGLFVTGLIILAHPFTGNIRVSMMFFGHIIAAFAKTIAAIGLFLLVFDPSTRTHKKG